ncbi:DUF417 family protein [Microbulbifer taiwanensis]|uniref:DUF417 family protein n=1 Tax=Microbulbifer taiwanensis TaxID=986746 RepID=A0ABW1YSS1_9GAMM|nr:DUF417 family protein [Microbulbifer taiwanensis]
MDYTWSRRLTLLLLAASFGLIGLALASGQMGGLANIADFYGVDTESVQSAIRPLAAVAFALLAGMALLCLFYRKATILLAWAMLGLSALPLLSLIGKSHWIDSLGGFPAIGSGQGVIKYFALVALALTWLYGGRLGPGRLAWLNYLPVGLVLLWIGGMKFTTLEAQGIEPLVASSPLMSWMYNLFDVQQASNIIGVYDLIALLLLALGLTIRRLFWPGILMCAAVFFTTQSFLASFPGAWSAPWQLSSSGIFIVKDLWFIANLLVLIEIRGRTEMNSGKASRP